MVGLQAMVLGRLGRTENSPSKSVCSILPIARHLRAGEGSGALTPARGSLLKPAAGQQVQSPNDRQGAYHRQRCEYPEEHSEHALPSLSLAVGYNRESLPTVGAVVTTLRQFSRRIRLPRCSEARCMIPASIMSLAALGSLRTWRGLCFVPSQRCARSSVMRS